MHTAAIVVSDSNIGTISMMCAERNLLELLMDCDCPPGPDQSVQEEDHAHCHIQQMEVGQHQQSRDGSQCKSNKRGESIRTGGNQARMVKFFARKDREVEERLDY